MVSENHAGVIMLRAWQAGTGFARELGLTLKLALEDQGLSYDEIAGAFAAGLAERTAEQLAFGQWWYGFRRGMPGSGKPDDPARRAAGAAWLARGSQVPG